LREYLDNQQAAVKAEYAASQSGIADHHLLQSGWERRNRLEEAIGKELFSMAHVATKTLLEWLCDPGVIKLGMTMQHKG